MTLPFIPSTSKNRASGCSAAFTPSFPCTLTRIHPERETHLRQKSFQRQPGIYTHRLPFSKSVSPGTIQPDAFSIA
jgi:hypothetical protein